MIIHATGRTAARRVQALAPALASGAHTSANSPFPEVLIVGASRTPVGSFNGQLKVRFETNHLVVDLSDLAGRVFQRLN